MPALLSASILSREPLRILGTCFELSERKSAEREIAGLLARTRRLQETTATVSAAASIADIARAVVHNGLEELSASAGILVRESAGEPVVEYAAGFEREAVEQWRAFPVTLPAALSVPAALPVPAGELLEGGTLVSFGLEGGGGEHLGCVAFTFRGDRLLDPSERDFLDALVRQVGPGDRPHPPLRGPRLRRAQAPGGAAAGPARGSARRRGGRPLRVDLRRRRGRRRLLRLLRGGAGPLDASWSATSAARAPRPRSSPGWPATRCARSPRRTDSPAALLAFLNRALRNHGEVPVVLHRRAARRSSREPVAASTATVSSGGHPFPLLLRADGTLEEVEIIGTMLGVADRPELIEVTVTVAPGDALILYTDGVTDARARGGIRFGEERLLATVRAAAGRDAEGIATTVEDAVRAHLPGPSADDRAILVLRARVGPPAPGGRRRRARTGARRAAPAGCGRAAGRGSGSSPGRRRP